MHIESSYDGKVKELEILTNKLVDKNSFSKGDVVRVRFLGEEFDVYYLWESEATGLPVFARRNPENDVRFIAYTLWSPILKNKSNCSAKIERCGVCYRHVKEAIEEIENRVHVSNLRKT